MGKRYFNWFNGKISSGRTGLRINNLGKNNEMDSITIGFDKLEDNTLFGIAFNLSDDLTINEINSRNAFLNPSSGNNYQSEKASEAIISGGFFGKGIGEGVLKNNVPEAHTDYIVSVISEEFGVLLILFILLIFLLLIFKVFIFNIIIGA